MCTNFHTFSDNRKNKNVDIFCPLVFTLILTLARGGRLCQVITRGEAMVLKESVYRCMSSTKFRLTCCVIVQVKLSGTPYRVCLLLKLTWYNVRANRRLPSSTECLMILVILCNPLCKQK